MSSTRITIATSLLLVFLIGSLAGCSGGAHRGGKGSQILPPPRLQIEMSVPNRLLKTNLIAIAPVAFPDRLSAVRGQESYIQELLAQEVRQKLGVEYLFLKDVSSGGADLPLAKAAKLGANALLYTRMTEFRERQGSRIGATDPAAVGFNMKLVAAPSGEPIWSGNYFFEDRALTDNLLEAPQRLRQGRPQWVTAEAALKSGFSEALSTLESERVKQFKGRQ